MGQLTKKYGWVLAAVIAAAAVGYCGWLVYTDAPAYRFLVRLYVDKKFLKQTLRQWGVLAPLVFIGLQALQVIISPIPGEATGFLGGYLFGEWLGLIYSTIGLTLGSVVAFWIGRWLGEHYVRNLVSKETWARLGFIVEAEGAILCFIIFVIPGLPKDMMCYLFGISPMPLWAGPRRTRKGLTGTRRTRRIGRTFALGGSGCEQQRERRDRELVVVLLLSLRLPTGSDELNPGATGGRTAGPWRALRPMTPRVSTPRRSSFYPRGETA